LRRSVGVQAEAEHTIIELTGRDRPGLLSEVFAVLADLKCNVVAAEVWTHNSRMASVVYITDEETGLSIDNPDRLAKIKQLLLYVLKGDIDKKSANTAVSVGSTHKDRRLHQLMYADRDYDIDDGDSGSTSDRNKLLVTVDDCIDKGYTVVNLRCPDRPKLLFDTVCTLTDMQYVVYHGTVIAEGPEAYQVSFDVLGIDTMLVLVHLTNLDLNYNYHTLVTLHVLSCYLSAKYYFLSSCLWLLLEFITD